jgi:hypothetical protein
MSNQIEQKLDSSILGRLGQMTVLELFWLLSKYPIVTRKMLLVVPKRPNNELENVTNAAATAMVVEAKKRSWDVKELRGNDASKINILDALSSWKPDFFAYYGHSLNSYIPGQSNDQLELAITPANAGVLSGRTACVTACSTVNPVGIPATMAKCVAYMGYSGFFTVLITNGAKLKKDFADGTNSVYLALLEGQTYKDAKSAAWKKWDDLWKEWTIIQASNSLVSPFVPAVFLDNRNKLDYVGDPKAVARPIGILLKT